MTRDPEHSPYIDIVEVGKSPTGRTKIFEVRNVHRHDIEPGIIKWHGPWRGYAYFVDADTVHDDKCLRQIADFVAAENERHGA